MKIKTGLKEQQIKTIMGRTWGIDPDKVSSEVKFNEIPQWDSLGHVNLLVSLEKEYNVKIDNETLTKLTSIPSIIEHIRKQGHVR